LWGFEIYDIKAGVPPVVEAEAGVGTKLPCVFQKDLLSPEVKGTKWEGILLQKRVLLLGALICI
jgi:hypothetical protein